MQEIEDPAIKLFGKKIPLSDTAATCEVKWTEEEEEEEEAGDGEEETEQGAAVDTQSQSEVPSAEGEGADESGASKSMKESSGRGKTLKKPDKILPCPRCDSMDTKFCYYNNYNVNQPRHFCRACQRYWTAGGMMRNMPVGAGRRKNKSTAYHYRHVFISGTRDGAKINVPNCIQPSDLKSNGVVLRFGVEQGEDCSSSASSVPILNSADNGSGCFLPDRKASNRIGIPSQIPCIPGFPWPYPWSPPAPPPGFYPAAVFWNWNIPFVLSQQPSSTNNRTSIPSTDSATLGKHSREPQPEVESLKQRNGCVIVPKIRRIDNPDEAAKSSIWTSLGIKHDESNTKGASSGGFRQMGLEKVRYDEKLPALHVNPAALSRSLNFHENN